MVFIRLWLPNLSTYRHRQAILTCNCIVCVCVWISDIQSPVIMYWNGILQIQLSVCHSFVPITPFSFFECISFRNLQMFHILCHQTVQSEKQYKNSYSYLFCLRLTNRYRFRFFRLLFTLSSKQKNTFRKKWTKIEYHFCFHFVFWLIDLFVIQISFILIIFLNISNICYYYYFLHLKSNKLYNFIFHSFELFAHYNSQMDVFIDSIYSFECRKKCYFIRKYFGLFVFYRIVRNLLIIFEFSNNKIHVCTNCKIISINSPFKFTKFDISQTGQNI